MEAIASTDGRYLISSVAPLLIQSHLPVQCSMILLIFTNVFVAVIDFRFFRVAFHKENSFLAETRVSFSLSIVRTGGTLLHLSCAAAELLFFSFFWGGGRGQAAMRNVSVSCIPACARRTAALMTNTWIPQMERWLQVYTPRYGSRDLRILNESPSSH